MFVLNKYKSNQVPDIVAPDRKTVHGDWSPSLHSHFDVLQVSVHRHVNTSNAACLVKTFVLKEVQLTFKNLHLFEYVNTSYAAFKFSL